MNNRPTNVVRSGPLSVWGAGRLLARALTEQKICMAAVYDTAARIVRPPAGAPPEYAVRLGEIPDSFYDARKNLFSTLFYSAYLALDIPLPRRLLYGKLNHLFRIWVTAADNLLDSEDKCVLPLDMPGTSRVMREVVALMAADRVLGHLLDDAVSEGVLTRQQAREVADASLRNLLPSAAQEASEEGGVTVRPAPEYVLETVHLLKTGLLFNIPFTGMDIVERDVDHDRLDRIKRALLLFGNGCQVLDDVRDVARDFVEGPQLCALRAGPHAARGSGRLVGADDHGRRPPLLRGARRKPRRRTIGLPPPHRRLPSLAGRARPGKGRAHRENGRLPVHRSRSGGSCLCLRLT